MGSWSNLRFCNLQPEISNSSILQIPPAYIQKSLGYNL